MRFTFQKDKTEASNHERLSMLRSSLEATRTKETQ